MPDQGIINSVDRVLKCPDLGVKRPDAHVLRSALNDLTPRSGVDKLNDLTPRFGMDTPRGTDVAGFGVF